MKYLLPGSIQYISCPVVLLTDGQEFRFNNGTEAIEYQFDKSYLIDEMYARNDEIVILLKDNVQVNNINWCGEEPVPFL